jgi:hypothetical protein
MAFGISSIGGKSASKNTSSLQHIPHNMSSACQNTAFEE